MPLESPSKLRPASGILLITLVFAMPLFSPRPAVADAPGKAVRPGVPARIEIHGAELEVEVKGTGERVLFFEAGALSGMAGWDSIWGRLPQGFTAIRYSRRGEGGSEPCDRDLSAADYVRDVVGLLEELGVEEPFVYVAHSYGGKIAREFAALHRGRLAGMLLVDPSNPRDVEIVVEVDPRNGPAENERIRQQDLEMGKGGDGRPKWCFIRDIWEKKPAPGRREIGDVPLTLVAGVRPNPDPRIVFQTDAARKRWGEIQAEWVEQFPRGRAVMARKSGHFVHDDQPELVLRELVRLLERADWR